MNRPGFRLLAASWHRAECGTEWPNAPGRLRGNAFDWVVRRDWCTDQLVDQTLARVSPERLETWKDNAIHGPLDSADLPIG